MGIAVYNRRQPEMKRESKGESYDAVLPEGSLAPASRLARR